MYFKKRKSTEKIGYFKINNKNKSSQILMLILPDVPVDVTFRSHGSHDTFHSNYYLNVACRFSAKVIEFATKTAL